MTLPPSLDAFRLRLRVADPFGCGWRRGIQHLRRRIARHHHPPIRYSSRRGAAVPGGYDDFLEGFRRLAAAFGAFDPITVEEMRLTPAEGARQQFLVIHRSTTSPFIFLFHLD